MYFILHSVEIQEFYCYLNFREITFGKFLSFKKRVFDNFRGYDFQFWKIWHLLMADVSSNQNS